MLIVSGLLAWVHATQVQAAGLVDDGRRLYITADQLGDPAVVNYHQGVTIAPYAITSFPAASAFSLTGTLPNGLTFAAATGVISGTPSGSGPGSVIVRASTSAGVLSQLLTINVAAATAPTISTNLPASPTVAGTVGVPIGRSNFAVIATTPPPITNYAADGLAAIGGLSVGATGLFTGTPTTSGDFDLTLRASNAGGAGTPLPIKIRINPDTAPIINAATNPPPANVKASFPAFALTASNGPIDLFAVVAPSTLPSGLSLAADGAITGTPNDSGVFKTSFSARNVAGTSAPAELTFTIVPTSVPAISTSPATIPGFLAGVPIAPIRILATNPAISAYAATGLPPGLTLSGSQIVGTPSEPGTYSATLSATNAAGEGSLVVGFSISVPAPSACAMSVPLNSAATLDLASCLFTGFAPTGVSIVSAPAHGIATTSGTLVTYTPSHDYFGSDSFSFVGTGAAGNSPPGTVAVTVTGRPDPTQDATVTGLLTAQNEAAQRFSRAQISNFQRRLESLHRSADDSGSAGMSMRASPGAGAAKGFASAAWAAAAAPVTPRAGGNLLASRVAAIEPLTTGAITAMAANHAPAAASADQVIDAVTIGPGVKALPFADSVLSLMRSGSVSLSGVASGIGLNATGSATGATSYWIEGIASFGVRDASGGISGSEFSSSGITVGADRRFGDKFSAGIGLGYARDKTLIGSDESVNRARGYSLALYGSYQAGANSFIDGLLGLGWLEFDSTRLVAPINDFALGQRRGRQAFGSLTGGYEFRSNNSLVSPYGRLDFATDRLNAATEVGAGAYALHYERHTSTSVQGALGVRAESVHEADFGYAIPRLRAEVRHEFKAGADAFMAYADQVDGPRYRLAAARGSRDSLLLGIGSDFILRDGLSLSLEYQLSHSFANASSQALRLSLTKDLDARGLPRLMVEGLDGPGDPINVQVEAGVMHDDNVTHAKAGPDRLDDTSYSVNVSKTVVQPLSVTSQLMLSATLGGEKFRRYNGLSRVYGGAEAEYQYRGSSDFDAPTLGLFARLTGEAYETVLRDGYRFSAGVSVRQALTDRINLFGALSHNLRNASSEVFSTRENAIRGNVDYSLGEHAILYLGAEFRRGDIVSTGHPSLENVTIADVLVRDDAYPGGQLVSYRLDGDTVLMTLGYNLALGRQDSIDFSWRHIRSTPSLRPDFVTSASSYIVNQFSLVYLLRF